MTPPPSAHGRPAQGPHDNKAPAPRAHPGRRPTALLCALGLASLLFTAAAVATPSEPLPLNVVWISADDMNDWIGALGGPAHTPNIDRLARNGVLFTRAYTAAPLCNPSRSALLYGRLPSTTGIYDNSHALPDRYPHLVGIPQFFRRHGYETMAVGKQMCLHDFDDRVSWDRQRVGHYTPRPDGVPLNGIPPLPDSTEVFDWGPLGRPASAVRDHDVAEIAARYLRRRHDRPFFLSIGFTQTHVPWWLPDEYLKLYPLSRITIPPHVKDDLDDVPDRAREMAVSGGHHQQVQLRHEWKQAIQYYLAAMTLTDAMLGRVMRALAAGPNRRSTLVVFWSDHGQHLGEKSHWRKQTLWERATHVPLVFSAPGRLPRGARCDRTVSLLDLYPTLAEIAGLTPPHGLEGRSLVPLLANPAYAGDWPASVTVHGEGNSSVRTTRWRYSLYEDGGEELYDEAVDPNEFTNLARRAGYSDLKRTLRGLLPRRFAPPPD
jgi:arylsulfatase A-like enzyme